MGAPTIYIISAHTNHSLAHPHTERTHRRTHSLKQFKFASHNSEQKGTEPIAMIQQFDIEFFYIYSFCIEPIENT